MTTRCHDCGRSVPSFFEHVDTDCLSAAFNQGFDDRTQGLPSRADSVLAIDGTMTDLEYYLDGWQSADNAATVTIR